MDVAPTVGSLTVGGMIGEQKLAAYQRTVDVAGAVEVVGTGLLQLVETTLGAASVTNSSTLPQTWLSVSMTAPITNDGTVLTRGTSSWTAPLTTEAGSTLDIGENSTLTLAQGFTNNGSLIRSARGGTLMVNQGPLTNAVGATIDVRAGNGSMSAALDNHGRLTVGDGGFLWPTQQGTTITTGGTITARGTLSVRSNQSFTNTGTLHIVATDLFIMNTANGTFETSGTISGEAGGSLRVKRGTLNHSGGSFFVGGAVYLTELTATFANAMTLGTDGPSELRLALVTLDIPSITIPQGTSQWWRGVTTSAVVTNEGTLSSAGDMPNVLGPLVVPGTADAEFKGGGSTLFVSGMDVDAAVSDGVPLVSTNGTIGSFDNVTFMGMDPSVTRLTITHSGASAAFNFDGLSFLTTPSTGLYISANDDIVDERTLTIGLTGSTPADGSANTATTGGATVTWPGADPG